MENIMDDDSRGRTYEVVAALYAHVTPTKQREKLTESLK
jgi:hypothetical protein